MMYDNNKASNTTTHLENSPPNASHSMPNMSNSSTPTEENGNKNIAVEQLANGFLNLYENDVIRVKSNLQEMLVKQGKMSKDLHELNHNYSADSLMAPQKLFDKVKIYKDKLHAIKKQMNSIHQRSKTVKKRVQNLQEFCSKEYDDRKQKQQQEEALIAKSTPTTISK